MAELKRKPKIQDFCTGYVHSAIHAIAHLVEEEARTTGLPVKFAASKIVEGDVPIMEKLKLMEPERDIIQHIVDDMENHLNTDREAAMADMRYSCIETICSKTVKKKGQTKEHLRSVKIDSILTHKFFALPIFLIIMLLMFWLTFGIIGSGISDLLVVGIDRFTSTVDHTLSQVNVSPALHSLIINGIFAGVGSVLSFLPIILVLFFFLSFLRTADIWQE